MTRATSFNACKETVDSGQRLTIRQGKALLDYAAMQSDRAERHAMHASQRAIDVEVLKEDYARLVEQWNGLVTALDLVLGIKVYSNELDEDKQPLWTVERDGKVLSTGHRTIALAYDWVLKERGI
jgi:hypothetical protein